MPRTKIVCTLGPTTESPNIIRELIRAGMTVARLNYSHGTPEEKQQMASMVRRIAAEEGRYVALMGDLQGPKIRVGMLPHEGVLLEEGKEITLTAGPVANPQAEVPFPAAGQIAPGFPVGSDELIFPAAVEAQGMGICFRICVLGSVISVADTHGMPDVLAFVGRYHHVGRSHGKGEVVG